MASLAPPPSSSAASAGNAPSGPQVLLLKLPTFVAEHLKRAAAGSSNTINVASMEVSFTEAGQQVVKLRYASSDPSQPSEFVVRPRNKRQMLVFTEKPATAADDTASQQQAAASTTSGASSFQPAAPPAAIPPPCKFLAPVSAIADVVPPDSNEYRALLSKRVASQLSANEVRRTEDSEQLLITPQVQQEIERRKRLDEERKERKGRDKDDRPPPGKEQKEGKRVRAEREVVESGLLHLFSGHQFLNIKQLLEATQQPQTYLKEILNDMCVRETRGEHKDQYQLKEKYRID